MAIVHGATELYTDQLNTHHFILVKLRDVSLSSSYSLFLLRHKSPQVLPILLHIAKFAYQAHTTFSYLFLC